MGITLTQDVERRIAAKVESGEYRSPDEVLRAGLDLIEARDAALQRAQRRSLTRQDSRSIGEVIAEIARKIPEEELSKLPSDLASNIDHYLYGAARSEPLKMSE